MLLSTVSGEEYELRYGKNLLMLDNPQLDCKNLVQRLQSSRPTGLRYSPPYQETDRIKRTGNPQITFFKVVYRRHTNFALESIEQTFNGQANWGKKVTCTISRNGDLIHRTYLQVILPDVSVPNNTAFRWVNWLGHALISTVEVEIGGQRIDKHYSDWLQIWNELTQTAGHQVGYANMVGNVPSLVSPTENKSGSAVTVKGQSLYIPLQFWFKNGSEKCL